MQFKNWLLKEEYLKNGSAVIYHRTGDEKISEIIATGFQSGRGDVYGKGFYATLDLESQNNQRMIRSYGNTITKWFIPHLNHFVIFNPILANMVHGTSSVDEQLKKIVGENLPQFSPKNSYDSSISKRASMHKSWLENPIAHEFSREYLNKLNPQQKDKIAGLIFNDQHDGNVFFAYKNDDIVFNGYVFAPTIMNNEKTNELKSGHGWQGRVGEKRIGLAYKDRQPTNIENPNLKSEKLMKKINDKFLEAASKGLLDQAKFLIGKGISNRVLVHAMEDAAFYGHIEIVELIIKHGVSEDVQFERGVNSAMMSAAEGGHIDIVKLLLGEGAGANYTGLFYLYKAMIEAAQNGYLDIVKLMIEKGAKDFNEAIKYAFHYGNKNATDFIQRHKKEYSIK
jgi:transcription antitermination factor NusG